MRKKDIRAKMARQEVKVTLGTIYSDYCEPLPLDNLLKQIEEIKNQNKNCKKFLYKLDVNGPYYEGDPSRSLLEIWGERLETDYEFNRRVDMEWHFHKMYCLDENKCRHK